LTSSPKTEPPGRLGRWLLRLRPEEVLALAFLVPTTYFTIVADQHARAILMANSQYPAAVARLAFAVSLLLLLALVVRHWPAAPIVSGAREMLPFFACVLIYTNLHDTLGFANPHDVHDSLAAFDQWLFGVQPTVWAERLITPNRTEFMNLLYWNFAWIAVLPSLLTLARGHWRDFRAVTFGIVLCFLLGYFLYVVFPAAPPRLALAHLYHVTLQGGAVSEAAERVLRLLPTDSRAAFPSLHAAVSVMALGYTWRLARWVAAVLLPVVLGLLASTIYLRHHFVADLVAGLALAFVAASLAPRLDRAWSARQRALGYAPALGAD
jgi:membrane-associated phospholipid phosphatase